MYLEPQLDVTGNCPVWLVYTLPVGSNTWRKASAVVDDGMAMEGADGLVNL